MWLQHSIDAAAAAARRNRQVYVENPLLIEGHKFDFGIYVLISSIDPLRVYYYNKNTLIRLCEKKYNPDDYSDVDSYVISDACLFPWDVDALAVYYNQTYTYKEALNAYLTKKGYDVSRIWTQVDDCIREVVLSKEEELAFWVSESERERARAYLAKTNQIPIEMRGEDEMI